MVQLDRFATLQNEFWFGYDRAIVVDVCDRDPHDHHVEFGINGNGLARLVFQTHWRPRVVAQGCVREPVA